MCGILGFIGRSIKVDYARFSNALDLLLHRGPNDGGIWVDEGIFLGHRRLSVLDLSLAGHQPMINQLAGTVIVFNGEIYNYIEIGKELEALGHKFVGHSDTEVLLHALTEWGPAVLPRLNGMWAFAFWSSRSKQLILSRDRFGVKPLYYCNNNKNFAFSSEPKSLLSLFPEYRRIDEHTLLDFLGNNVLHAKANTFYKNIHAIPPAHYAVYDMHNCNINMHKYWDYPQNFDCTITENQAIEEFATLFKDSVRLRMRSDVPVGVSLSGGLDSTAVLSEAIKYSKSPITCFTSIYDKIDDGELNWAARATKGNNTILIPVKSPYNDWLVTLRKIVWHMDSPGYSPAVYPLWNLMKRAQAECVPVIMEGQGADEALAGYPQYAVLDLLSYILCQAGQNPNMNGVISRIIGMSQTFGLRWSTAWFAREMSPKLLDWHRRTVGFQSLMRRGLQIPKHSPGIKISNISVRNRLIDDHSENILPGLLHYGDSISMAHSIETRNPFLDFRLVEWMIRLQSYLRFNNGESKWVLREYLRNNSQVEIGNRRDKKGYPTPIKSWLAREGESEIEHLIMKNDNPLFEWCDPQKVKRLIINNKNGIISTEHHLYKLLSTQLWIEECIKGSSN